MTKETPIDYQDALDAFRKEEHAPQTPIRSTGEYPTPPITDGFVDYEAASKAWDKEQEGLYKIHLQAGKRNPSHDPIYRGEDNESPF